MEFVKTTNGYEATFESEGKVMVQLKRVSDGGIEVATSVSGTDYAIIGGERLDADCAFCINTPSGAHVKITSTTAVTSAETLNF